MGILEKFFGRKNLNNTTTRFELVTDNGGGFYAWNGGLYKSDIVRSCIRPKAKAIGKLVAKHIRQNEKEFKVNPDPSLRMLLEEPNPLMTGQVMQEKLATQLELNNNAFAYIKRDELGYPMEIYPVPCASVEAVQGQYGDLFLKFFFRNGQQMTVPYTDVIHLRKDFNENDIFGDSPGEALAGLMEVITTTDQGIVKAIKSSAVIKWILKFKSVLKDEDIEKNITNFVTKPSFSLRKNGSSKLTRHLHGIRFNL